MTLCLSSPIPLLSQRRPRSPLTRLPRYLPAMMATVSPRRTWLMSDDLRRERDDLRELPLAELARDRAEDARADRILVRLEEHDRVAVEADVRAVLASDLLHRPDHHRASDLALLHGPVGRRFLHGHDHGGPQGRVALVGATHHADALHPLGPRVVRHVEHRPRLDH